MGTKEMQEIIERFMRLYGQELHLQLIHTFDKIKANMDGDALICMRQMLIETVKKIDRHAKDNRFIIVDDAGEMINILPGAEDEVKH
jgi:predicted ribosome-associated RNA-binding protein Tma20